MLFNSLAYVGFLIIVFTLYWIIPDRFRWILIVIASYFFYMCSGPKYGLIIFGVTTVSYLSGRLLEKQENKRKRKAILSLTVIVCMGVLFFFKYFNFAAKNIIDLINLFGVKQDYVTFNIILPVGISFYTFQTMSYVIDVYKGDTKVEHHFGKYMAFVSFFPQLVAGPIERSNNLIPQINAVHRFNYDQAISGVKLMLWGYFKKLAIADVVSVYVKEVFNDPHNFTGFALTLASVFFALQIYCDFSGYSDIAIGTAKLFGFELMTNFRSPYLSRSVKEFWSRWHISLSTWFRDYVYIPLGGNRVSKVRHYINLMITFLASGLWHGANWTFVAWGGIHGLAQVIENIIFKKKNRDEHPKVIQVLEIIAVFVFAVFAWVFFVAHSFSDAVYVISHSFNGITAPLQYLKNGYVDVTLTDNIKISLIVCIAVLAAYDIISQKDKIRDKLANNKIVQWIFYIVISLMIILMAQKGVAAEFIYFQF